jgi:hypothetical protein
MEISFLLQKPVNLGKRDWQFTPKHVQMTANESDLPIGEVEGTEQSDGYTTVTVG